MKLDIDWERKPEGNCDRCGKFAPLIGIPTKKSEVFLCKACAKRKGVQ